MQEVTTELTGLKRHITQMTSAIFGSRSSNLGQEVLIKLKADYTLVEQLYTGAQRTIATISRTNQAPSLLSDVLSKLSVLPARIEEIKRPVARAGAITALSRAKAWQEELDPAELATSFPSFKEDGSPFDKKDFAACVKEMRPLASLIAEETYLSRYQATYTADNQKMPTQAYEIVDLIPPIHKHTFAPAIDPSELIDDEAEFQALTGINWSSPNFQTMDEEEEPVQDDLEASSLQDQEN